MRGNQSRMFFIERLNLVGDRLHAPAAELRIIVMVTEIGKNNFFFDCVDVGNLLRGPVHGTMDREGSNDSIR